MAFVVGLRDGTLAIRLLLWLVLPTELPREALPVVGSAEQYLSQVLSNSLALFPVLV